MIDTCSCYVAICSVDTPLEYFKYFTDFEPKAESGKSPQEYLRPNSHSHTCWELPLQAGLLSQPWDPPEIRGTVEARR